MNGPFLELRDIAYDLPFPRLRPRTMSRELAFLGSRVRRAERGLAPRRDRVTALGLALAAAVRVVDRVHRGAAHRRALAQPARATGLAAGLVLVRRVARPRRSSRGRSRGRGGARRRAGAGAPGRPPWRPAARSRRPSAPSSRPGRAAARRRAPSCRSGSPSSGRQLPDLDVGVGAGLHRRPDLQPLPARGCRPSRRPRSAAARCAPSGWGRTRSRRPWPARRPCGA